MGELGCFSGSGCHSKLSPKAISPQSCSLPPWSESAAPRGDAFGSSPLRMMFAVGLSYSLYYVEVGSLYTSFWRVFIINGCWLLLKAFSASVKIIMWFFWSPLDDHTIKNKADVKKLVWGKYFESQITRIKLLCIYQKLLNIYSFESKNWSRFSWSVSPKCLLFINCFLTII